MNAGMRRLLLILLALPVRAQTVPVLCEPPPETLRLLEAVPAVRDTTIPYEQRVGALRALAQKYGDDFFIQRTYQDSFRQERSLGEEFDRALKAAAQRKLPERKKRRKYPREVYVRRHEYAARKSTPTGLSASPVVSEKTVT